MEKPDYVLILAGDHIYKMNYTDMLDFHQANGAELTISVVELPKEEASHLGIVDVDAKAKVIGFEEKPTAPKTIIGDPNKVYASMGIYIFNREILEEELIEDAKHPSQHDFGKDIIPNMIKKKGRIYAYNFKDENKKEAKYWRDIGTIDAYYEANIGLTDVDPIFNLYDKEWPIRTYHEQCPPAKTVFAGGEIGNRVGLALDSLISGGCIISGGKVQRSVLSHNVRINSYSQVLESVIMEGVDVGRYAKIKRAIIDKDVKIPRGMAIGYDLEEDRKRFAMTDSGIVVVAKGTILE
jgi:glucose-1-phosphate adenylyltransferase